MKNEKKVLFGLPKEIKGKYNGEHIKVLNLGNWLETEVFIENKKIEGLLQGIDIKIRIDELANVTLHFKDIN